MSPRTSKQLKIIREEKRKLIMNTALKLFAEEGYYITSIDKIAKAANISKGLIYNYFQNKEDLLSEIFHFGLDEIFKSFDQNHDGILTKDEFILFIENSLDKLENSRDFWKLYFILIMKPMIYKMFEKSLNEYLSPIMQMLENYFTNQGSENPEAEAKLIGAILDGVGMHYILNPENFKIKEVKEIIIKKYI